MWIDTDVQLPESKQLVEVKVADFAGDYTTIGYYDVKDFRWYSEDGLCLNDNVFKWRTIKQNKHPFH